MATPSDNLHITGLPAGIDQAKVKEIFGAYGEIQTVTVVGQAAYIKFATVEEAQWIQENLSGNMPEGLTEPIEVKYSSAAKGKGKEGGKGGKDSWSKGGSGKDDWSKGGKGDWSNGWSKGGKGEKGESWGPYAKGDKDSSGKGKDGKGKGKGKVDIKTLFEGLCSAGALPGGEKYENDENTLFVGSLPSDTTDLDLYKIFSPFGPLAPKGIRAMVFRDTGLCKGIGFVNFMDASAAQAAIAALNGTQMGDDGTVLVVSSKRLSNGKGEGKGEGKGKW